MGIVLSSRGPSITAPVPPAEHWGQAVPAGGCMCWCAARCLLPGRPTAAQSADAAGGACPRLESPQKSNALCPGRRCPSGSEAPDPDLCRREMT